MRLSKFLALVFTVGAALVLFGYTSANASEVIEPDAPKEDKGETVYMTSEENLTAYEVAQLARAAGFSGNDLVIAVAVAFAESSGNPTAYNPETKANAPVGKGSFGLWQIYLNKHPEFNNENLYDPATNARAAFSVWRNAGKSFHPWSTFNSGAYQAHLNDAQGAVEA